MQWGSPETFVIKSASDLIEEDGMSRIRINSDFGSGISVAPEVAKVAARAVALNTTGTDDGRLLLDMLGLIPAQPGFEIVSHTGRKNEITAVARRAKRKKDANYTPEEIGEPEDES